MVGFRNIAEVNLNIVRSIIKNNLKDFEALIHEIQRGLANGRVL